nr:glycosyltransferase [Gemmatimonadaceae bacterium]
FELVLVANFWPGSGDVTAEVVEAFSRQNEHVRTVIRQKEGDMGWDMRSGLDAAGGEFLIVIDGDEQNPVDDVLRMYRLMAANGADVMKGRRTTRGDGVSRWIVTTVYNTLFRLIFRTKGMWDINGKPKGLRRDAYSRMTLHSKDWFTDAEIVLAARRMGMTILEMPVVFLSSDRASLVRPSAILEFLANMILYRVRGRPKG